VLPTMTEMTVMLLILAVGRKKKATSQTQIVSPGRLG
jgi:hypothetical protein